MKIGNGILHPAQIAHLNPVQPSTAQNATAATLTTPADIPHRLPELSAAECQHLLARLGGNVRRRGPLGVLVRRLRARSRLAAAGSGQGVRAPHLPRLFGRGRLRNVVTEAISTRRQARAERREHRQERRAERQAHRQERRAERQAHRQERRAERQEHRQERRAERQEHRQERRAERQEHRQERRAERQEHRQERRAERQERRAGRRERRRARRA